MSYQGLRNIVSTASPHLGGNLDSGDPFSFSPRCWDYLIRRFCVQSILDLGSGLGEASFYFHSKGMAVIAVDGLSENINHAAYPTVRVDLSQTHVETRVDLVHCQEFVEHVSEKFVDNIIKSFQSGKFLCMTHAFPGQGGHHHVNEQPPEYWIKLLSENGFCLLQEDTKRVRSFAAEDGATYLSKSGLVFRNKLIK